MTRLATSADFEFVYQLYMHQQVNEFLLYERMEAAAFFPIFERLLEQQQKYIYGDENTPMGMFKLVPQPHRNHHIVYLGGVAIHPRFSGNAQGSKMLQEIIEIARNRGFLRVELSVSVLNERAIHLYQKAGFEKEGLLKKFTHLREENRFVDEVMMAYLF